MTAEHWLTILHCVWTPTQHCERGSSDDIANGNLFTELRHYVEASTESRTQNRRNFSDPHITNSIATYADRAPDQLSKQQELHVLHLVIHWPPRTVQSHNTNTDFSSMMLTQKYIWGHILITSWENLRKISHLRTVFDNIWENTNQT